METLQTRIDNILEDYSGEEVLDALASAISRQAYQSAARMSSRDEEIVALADRFAMEDGA